MIIGDPNRNPWKAAGNRQRHPGAPGWRGAVMRVGPALPFIPLWLQILSSLRTWRSAWFADSAKVLAAVDADDVPGHPARPAGGKGDQCLRDILRSRQALTRIGSPGVRENPLMTGDLACRRRISDSGAHRVGADAKRRQLECQLADVGFQRRLGGRHGPIGLPDPMASGAGHGKDLCPPPATGRRRTDPGPSRPGCVPSHRASCSCRRISACFRCGGNEGLQGAERQRVQQASIPGLPGVAAVSC